MVNRQVAPSKISVQRNQGMAYFEHIESGARADKVFMRFGYKKCLEHFMETFDGISGINYVPNRHIVFYSKAGAYLAVSAFGEVANSLVRGTDECRALNNDLSEVSWLINSFAEYLRYTNEVEHVTLGTIKSEWPNFY